MFNIIVSSILFNIIFFNHLKKDTHHKQDIQIVYATSFGVKADFNGFSGTDNTIYLQNAIDEASKQNKTLILPKGKILLNSYGPSKESQAHKNILLLRSNLRILGNESEIVVGKYFNDKPFIVLSGFNNLDATKFASIANIEISNIIIDFNHSKNSMRSKYTPRRGIELGNAKNVVISKSIFRNGDISCAIGSGHGKSKSANVSIIENKFLNIVNSKTNTDHSTIYLNSNNSNISNNTFFLSGTQGKLMACGIEIHNSNIDVFANKIEGYTRMMYIATINSENNFIENIIVKDNTANITNAAIYLWLDQNTSQKNILIENNSITCNHLKGYSMLYNGTQGIISDARDEENTSISNLIAKNNKITISNTEIKGRAVKYNTKYQIKDINNNCVGCKDGINAYKK
ncbi:MULTISPECIES: hypothetical protein [Bacteroidota]|uniref:hypothetical protein n=1 Tax=Bacteroidota TaxID=976 RepID=UPI000DF88017|nr:MULTISPECIES: hypothetical protein [Bacteroidota]QQT43603.1 hypothetical protein I6J00_17865 [Sphingobacterium multivorum]SUI97896.1 Uncharacterised protein [Sphingobacterium multivorum]